MIEELLNIIFPKKCIYCKKQGEGYLCSSCFCALKGKSKITFIKNKEYNYLIYVDKYKGNMRYQMHNFKFYEKAYYYEYFIKLVLENQKIEKLLKSFDLIVPVPMLKKKKLQRGYNQTELLANELSKRIKVNVSECLIKAKENKTQSMLTKVERFKNVEDVFKLANNMDIMNKRIILIDDIFTTGATISSCAHVLKEAGASRICVLVIAKT